MNEHFVITADRGHLRIFKHRDAPEQSTPALDEVGAEDFPAGLQSYVDRDTDMAGRFQSSQHQSAAPGSPPVRQGMSIDERLPMQREEDRRTIRDVAAGIEEFLRTRPHATWDFAAGPAVHNAVLEALPPPTRARLRQSVAKNLLHQPISQLAGQFASE